MLILFLVFSSGLLVSAKVPVCPPGGTHFDPPQNLSITIQFPPRTNDSYPYFPTNYLCNYQINVPQGLYATVTIFYRSLNQTDETSKIVVTDRSHFSETFTAANYERFFFTSNGGNITLSTGISQAALTLYMTWKTLPSAFTPVQIQINVSNTEPSTIPINNPDPFYLVTADTRVSILAIPSVYDSYKFILRGILVYDGPTYNSYLLGNAMQLWMSNKQWVSTGNQLTVQVLEGNSYDTETVIVLQDYENTKHIVNYQCGYCFLDTTVLSQNDCQYTLDNALGTSAVITSMDPALRTETITVLNGNGSIDVYIGGVTQSKSNLVVSYPVQNAGLTLPQVFRGTIRTYVLEGVHTRAVMNLTRERRDDVDPMGSKKLIMSNYYPQIRTDQYASVGLKAPDNTSLVTFSYRFRCADIAKKGTLRIQVQSERKTVYDITYTASNPPPINTTLTNLGDHMSLYMSSNGGESKGLLMEYEILKAASMNFCILVFVVPILKTIF